MNEPQRGLGYLDALVSYGDRPLRAAIDAGLAAAFPPELTAAKVAARTRILPASHAGAIAK